MKCLERHSKCYRPFPRQIFNLILVHVRQTQKVRCISKSGRAEFLKHMQCVKSKGASEPAHVCLDKWTVQMKLISDTFTIEDHFPGVCCSYHMMKTCLVDAVLKACKSTTGDEQAGREAAKYTEKTVSETFIDFLDLACGRQKNMDDCHRTFSNGTQTLLEAVASSVPPQTGSALFHALKIVTRHD